MAQLSNGYVMGYLCGYMKDRMDPRTFGYHRGYIVKKAAAEPVPEEAKTGTEPVQQPFLGTDPATQPRDVVANATKRPTPVIGK